MPALRFSASSYDFYEDDDGHWNVVPQGSIAPTHCGYANPRVIAQFKGIPIHMLPPIHRWD